MSHVLLNEWKCSNLGASCYCPMDPALLACGLENMSVLPNCESSLTEPVPIR
jgi:hypothetical protein